MDDTEAVVVLVGTHDELAEALGRRVPIIVVQGRLSVDAAKGAQIRVSGRDALEVGDEGEEPPRRDTMLSAAEFTSPGRRG